MIVSVFSLQPTLYFQLSKHLLLLLVYFYAMAFISCPFVYKTDLVFICIFEAQHLKLAWVSNPM